jgi:serine/threonine protein kinase
MAIQVRAGRYRITASGGAFQVPDPLSQLTAFLVDRYRIEGELGHGGMATVYLARDLKHDRLVAIKVLRSELAHVLGPERFLREIEIAARLQHPLILPVFDSGASTPSDAGTA